MTVHPKQHQHCRNVQEIEVKKSPKTVDCELFNGIPEKEHAVDFRVIRNTFEMDPSEHQRKCDRKCQHAAP